MSKLAIQFRIEDEFHAKAKVIAENEMRSLNSQLEYFIKKGIEQYETEHGEIVIPDEQ